MEFEAFPFKKEHNKMTLVLTVWVRRQADKRRTMHALCASQAAARKMQHFASVVLLDPPYETIFQLGLPALRREVRSKISLRKMAHMK